MKPSAWENKDHFRNASCNTADMFLYQDNLYWEEIDFLSPHMSTTAFQFSCYIPYTS